MSTSNPPPTTTSSPTFAPQQAPGVFAAQVVVGYIEGPTAILAAPDHSWVRRCVNNLITLKTLVPVESQGLVVIPAAPVVTQIELLTQDVLSVFRERTDWTEPVAREFFLSLR